MNESQKFLKFVIDWRNSKQIHLPSWCCCNHNRPISLAHRSYFLQVFTQTISYIFSCLRVIKPNCSHIRSYHNKFDISLINQMTYLNVFSKINITNNLIIVISLFKNSYFIINTARNQNLNFIFCCNQGQYFCVVFRKMLHFRSIKYIVNCNVTLKIANYHPLF